MINPGDAFIGVFLLNKTFKEGSNS